MPAGDLAARIARLPKAELHLHLEGSIAPATLIELGARHGLSLTPDEVAEKYEFTDFAGFLEAYKWATSLLQEPADYALITERLGEELLRQNVVYAEVTLSVGVMLWRNQDVEANYAAIRAAGQAFEPRGLRMQFIIDATRQFGAAPAKDVARLAAQCKNDGVVAFGLGGDELSVPTSEFVPAYELAAAEGLRRVAHAGEIGPPELVREAVELLGAERIGHGIAAMNDAALQEWLIERGVALEICPTSNLCTGALARQLGKEGASLRQHPLKAFFERGLRVTLSTDDPAMFRTSLLREYELAARMGLSGEDLARLARNSFHAAFLPAAVREEYLAAFDAGAAGMV